MPELPEVETVRRGLNQLTCDQLIQGCEVHLARTIAYPSSLEAFKDGITGTAIAQWHRRGKYLLAELIQNKTSQDCATTKQGGWLAVHLRMTGQLLWQADSEPLQKHCRVQIFFPQQKELRFVDQRTFGQLWWVPPQTSVEQIVSGLQRLGPEPLTDAFSLAYFNDELHRRHRPIKNALLDQSIVAGIGNIYADESLFLSHIHPQTGCDQLTDSALQRLHHNIIQVLETSIMAGGTTFSDFRDIKGINGNYGQEAWVYGRTGQPCKICKASIERLKLAGRSAHFCPHCQTLHQ